MIPCRFAEYGCQSPAAGIFFVPEGCHCWPDPVQALCNQHTLTMESTGPISRIHTVSDTAKRIYTSKRWAAWVYHDRIEIRLEDGALVVGRPPSDADFLASARYLGYGDDIYWHMVEHDLLHAMVADRFGIPRSGALWAQAHGWSGGEMPASGLLEEQRLTAVQRLINNLPIDDNEWAQIGWDNLMVRFDNAWAIERFLIDPLRSALRPAGVTMTSTWASSPT